MINITSQKAKRLYQAEFSRQMTVLENTFVKEVRPLLGRQFYNAANLVSHGILIEGVNHAVDLGRRRWIELFQKHYKRVASTFSKKAYNIIDRAQKSYSLFPEHDYLLWCSETKGPKDEFWSSINKWANTQAAQKIRKIQQTTKNTIATVIHKGMQEGESHRNIAKRIRKTSAAINPHRARTIALTETHSAAVKSVDTAVASTRIEMQREWVSAKDMRTRRPDKNNIWNHYGDFPAGANGERVTQDGKFVGTGQALDHPGDPKGSVGNIVRCRCVLIYNAVKVQDKLKPYEPEEVPEWDNLSLSNTSKRLEDKHNIQVGQMAGYPSSTTAATALADVGKELDRMNALFTTKIEKDFSLNLYNELKIEVPAAYGKTKILKGEYNSFKRRMKVAFKSTKLSDKPALTLGKHFVGKDRFTLFRHEYGHHFYSYSKREGVKDWVKLFDKVGGDEYFHKNISTYAGTNASEAFAESFAAFTSPKYKKGMLPKEIEGYFEKLLKGK